jgi:hypothetical protein
VQGAGRTLGDRSVQGLLKDIDSSTSSVHSKVQVVMHDISMDTSRGKQLGSRQYGRGCEGWTIVLWLSIFVTGVLIGSSTSGHVSSGPGRSQPSSAMHKIQLHVGNKQRADANASADLLALSRLNQMLISQKLDTQGCDPQDFGTGWGKHALCTKQAPSRPCHFYSFGERCS